MKQQITQTTGIERERKRVKPCIEIQNDAKTFDSKKSNHIFHVEYKLKCLRIETNVTNEQESEGEGGTEEDREDGGRENETQKVEEKKLC